MQLQNICISILVELKKMKMQGSFIVFLKLPEIA